MFSCTFFQEAVEFVKSCQHDCGGFGANPGHDPHILYSLSAVQILCLYDCIDEINTEKLISYIKDLQVISLRYLGRLVRNCI